MFRSIRWRLVLSYMLLTLLIVSMVGVLALNIVARHARQQELEGLQANARAVAQQAYPLIWPIFKQAELSQLIQTASYFGNVQVRILDEDGKLLIDSGDPTERGQLIFFMPSLDLQLFPEINFDPAQVMIIPEAVPLFMGEVEFTQELLPPGTSVTVIHRSLNPWGNRFSFEKLPVRGQRFPQEKPFAYIDIPRSEADIQEPIAEGAQVRGYVELSAAPDFGSETLTAVRRALLIAGAGAVLLAGLVGMWISQRLASPIRALTSSAAQMSAGDLSARADIQQKDEIGQLAAQFNHMATTLEENFNQLASERDTLRRFISDASHELRTPITALKNFNTLLQDAASDDPVAQGEFLNESQAQIDRLEWITQNLLDLSRLDAGLLALDIGDCPLGDLIEAAATPFMSLASKKNISFKIELPDPDLYVPCDRARMEMALSNLLDNALKFTPTGGQIEVGAKKDEDSAVVWVDDTGVGISAEDFPHIFKRFYRGREHQDEGSGLGLAIVESIVQAHGGEVRVESTPGEGAQFTIRLPLAAPTT